MLALNKNYINLITISEIKLNLIIKKSIIIFNKLLFKMNYWKNTKIVTR
jgi:hypothetical protein